MRPGFQRCAQQRPEASQASQASTEDGGAAGGAGEPGPRSARNFSGDEKKGLVLPRHQRLPYFLVEIPHLFPHLFPPIFRRFWWRFHEIPQVSACPQAFPRRHFWLMELVTSAEESPEEPGLVAEGLEAGSAGENFKGPRGKKRATRHQTFGKSWQIMANVFSIFLAVIILLYSKLFVRSNMLSFGRALLVSAGVQETFNIPDKDFESSNGHESLRCHTICQSQVGSCQYLPWENRPRCGKPNHSWTV